MDNIAVALIMTLAAGAATAIGALLIIFKKKISSNTLAGALGLSAGVMIFVSLAELYPEAQAAMKSIEGFRHGDTLVLISFFIGIAIITIIDFLIPDYENPHEATELSIDSGKGYGKEHSIKRLGILSALAITIHNFPEGMATFISALNDTQMGISITFAIAIHNIPEGIAVAIPIYYSTGSKRKALFYAALSGLSEPVGAGIAYIVSVVCGIPISDGSLTFPLVLASVAGIMIFISLDELLPNAEKHGKHHIAITGVISGMAIMGISLLLF